MRLINFYNWVIVIFALIGFQSCTHSETTNKSGSKEANTTISDSYVISGQYVSEGYHQRDTGYDWVGIIVRERSGSDPEISVRSRADKKKPTCTYDGVIYPENEKAYSNVLNGSRIIYSFYTDSLVIKAENRSGSDAIMFYCSGGGTFEGVYTKIDGPLDTEQVDQTIFQDFLMLQDRGYAIKTTPQGNDQKLEISVIGVNDIKEPHFENIESNVKRAEIEDLDMDGSPELVIFFAKSKNDKERSPLVYSISDGSSLFKPKIPELTNNPDAMMGYIGKDEFALVEASIIRRFPIYKIEGSDTTLTDKTRQLIYKLGNDGQFYMKDIQEY